MRQALGPPTQVIDGLDGAFDYGRTGFEAPGTVLSAEDAALERFPDIARDLRLANVRWLLSFDDVPVGDRARLVAQVPVLGADLHLYALTEPIARVFWVPRCESAPTAAAAHVRVREETFDPRRAVVIDGGPCDAMAVGDSERPARVELHREGPHDVTVEANTPPGFIVVIESYHPAWRAELDGSAVPLRRANARYWAVATPGGARRFRFRLHPGWPRPAFACAALGVLLALAVIGIDRRRRSSSATCAPLAARPDSAS
jgi:hypothetical protein